MRSSFDQIKCCAKGRRSTSISPSHCTLSYLPPWLFGDIASHRTAPRLLVTVMTGLIANSSTCPTPYLKERKPLWLTTTYPDVGPVPCSISIIFSCHRPRPCAVCARQRQLPPWQPPKSITSTWRSRPCLLTNTFTLSLSLRLQYLLTTGMALIH